MPETHQACFPGCWLFFSRTGVIPQCYECLAVWNVSCVPGRFCSLLFPILSEMHFGIISLMLFYYYLKYFKD